MSTTDLPCISDHDLERVTGGFLEEGDSGGWGEGDADSMTGMDTSPSWSSLDDNPGTEI